MPRQCPTTSGLAVRSALSPWLGLLGVAATLAAIPGHAETASLSNARALLQAGKYPEAEKAFRALTRQRAGQAWLGLGRLQLLTGRHQEALQSAARAARGKTWAAAVTLRGEVQLASGDRTAAAASFAAVVKRDKKAYRALLFAGLTQHELGQQSQAKATFDIFYDDYGDGTLDKTSAELLTYVAIACRYSDNFRDASDVFADAIKIDDKQVEAFIHWAEISLEKYEAAWAEKHFRRALAVNPHHPRALVGLAQAHLELSGDVRQAEELLQRARTVDPNSNAARVVQAQILIDDEQYREGAVLLSAALKRNPNDLQALAMLAASAFLRDDRAGFARAKQRAFAINPRYSPLYHTVVKLAVRHHRYAEAIQLGLEAIALDPNDPYALADLGTNYLRVGDDQTGLRYLRQAWQGDRYNVRNYNLLNLFEDVVARHYEILRTKHFRLRVHKREKALIERLIVPVLERAYAKYARKYRFQPKLPITVELFQDPEHYAIRTVGLPGLSAVGVCFGQVITTTSPLAGRFNWGQVLWHELNHVFTIQLSRSRVPRWLTEGLADMEPALERSEWKRENDFDIYKGLRSGRLHGLASMNSAFTRARSLRDMVVAYYQGSLMAGYLVQHWGLDRVLEALRLYGRGQATEQVLPRITGLGLAEIDARFRTAQLARLAHYNSNWYVDLEAYRDLAAHRKQAEARPDDAELQAGYAAALLVANQQRAARAALGRALKAAGARLAAAPRLALFLAAQLDKDPGETRKYLEALVAAGGDGYQAQVELGKLALQRKDLAALERHLGRAKRFDPEQALPYSLLYQAYDKAGQTDRAIAELEQLATLDQQDFRPVARLVLLLAQRKDHAGVRKYGEMAYYIAPASVTLHQHLADAYLAPAPKADLRRAQWHLETALMTEPKKSVLAGLHARLARLHLLRNDRARARSHFDRARAADPNLPELSGLKSDL